MKDKKTSKYLMLVKTIGKHSGVYQTCTLYTNVSSIYTYKLLISGYRPQERTGSGTYRGAAIWQSCHAHWSAHLVWGRERERGRASLLQNILSLHKVLPGRLGAVNQINLQLKLLNAQTTKLNFTVSEKNTNGDLFIVSTIILILFNQQFERIAQLYLLIN